MILAVDVDYQRSNAQVAGVLFDSWVSTEELRVFRSIVPNVGDYEPGSFYKRELPCILKLIEEHNIKPKTVVIDGYVHLGKNKQPGLGMHLFNALKNQIPVVGVAKKPFLETPSECEIYRGKSSKPLYVTSAGMELEVAKEKVISMHGENRIPVLLKTVDRECRKA